MLLSPLSFHISSCCTERYGLHRVVLTTSPNNSTRSFFDLNVPLKLTHIFTRVFRPYKFFLKFRRSYLVTKFASNFEAPRININVTGSLWAKYLVQFVHSTGTILSIARRQHYSAERRRVLVASEISFPDRGRSFIISIVVHTPHHNSCPP